MKKVVLLLFALISAAFAANVTVTINDQTEYQKIDGFGAYGAKELAWGTGSWFDSQWLAKVVGDLGLTIVRIEMPTNLMTSDQFGSSDVIDLSKFNVNTAINNQPCVTQSPTLRKYLDYLTALKAESDKENEPLKVIASSWSPPSWMKYIGCVWGTDALWNRLSNGLGPNNDFLHPTKDTQKGALPNYYSKYAMYCAGFCEIVKQQTQIDIYAFSPQNEPAFAEGYQSCVYNTYQMRDLVTQVGKRFAKESIPAKIMIPEDVPSYAKINAAATFIDSVGDTCARNYAKIFAAHGYGSDGIHAPTTDAGSWGQYYAIATKYNKPLWMTETSGYVDQWDGYSHQFNSGTGQTDTLPGAFFYGQAIYTALRFGKVSAWVWWTISGENSQFALMDSAGAPTKRYYVSKNFYRYIRPDAIMMDTKSSDSTQIGAIAFNHKTNKTLTVVLFNFSSADNTVTLSGKSLPANLNMYRTSSSENCASIGSVASANPIAIPAKSIVTLYATGYDVSGASIRMSDVPSHRFLYQAKEVRIYSMNGTLVKSLGADALANGAVHWNGLDKRGNRSPSGAYIAVTIDRSGARIASRAIQLWRQ